VPCFFQKTNKIPHLIKVKEMWKKTNDADLLNSIKEENKGFII
jgi:hypothetical protein